MHSKPSPSALGPSNRTQAPVAAGLDWDDLRYVLAVARAGSLSGAARNLSVTHSTMLRRIDAIEAKLQVRLFERMRNGYVPTEAGDTLRQMAEQCEPLVAEAERRIVGGDTRLKGMLRVTTVPIVGHHLLPNVLAEFCAAHPDIEVEMGISLERVDLSQRAADVALRVSTEVPDYLVGRKLGDIRFRIYAWRAAPFLSGKIDIGTPLPIQTLTHELPWISFERDVQERPSNRWLHANVPPSSVVIRTDHFASAVALLHTGMGISLLPEVVAHDAPELIPLSEPIDELNIPLWILTHPDLRNTARVRAFMQMVGDRVADSLR